MAANQPTEAVANDIVDALRRTGLLLDSDKATALSVVTAELRKAEADVEPRPAPARGPRLAEVGGYAGAALVMAAVALLLAQRWEYLTVPTRIAWLGGIAAALTLAAVVMATVVGPRRTLATDTGARRHLVAVLAVVAAVATAGAVGTWVDELVPSPDVTSITTRAAVWASLALLVPAYLLAAHGIVQVAIGFAAFMLVQASYTDSTPGWHLAVAGTTCLLGVVWLVLAEGRLWRERTVGRLVGGAYVLVAAQALGFDYRDLTPKWWAYVATFLVALAALAMYLWRDDWAYLVVGVIALTVAVTQTLVEWTGGSLGAGGAVLAAGLTMLAASGLALWLRHRRARRDLGEELKQETDKELTRA